MRARRTPRYRALATLAMVALAGSACGILPFAGRPANGYVYGSGEPLRVAVIDQTGVEAWHGAIAAGVEEYAAATPFLQFWAPFENAHIVITFRSYSDETPPELVGYAFPRGVGGFAAVYDAQGEACNYPPAEVPMNCSGEIARADIYLNEKIPDGDDIERRRLRLVLHELGHAMGLTRHSPDLDIGQLAKRYGWPQ